MLARELYPGKFHPTVSHAFISLLARKGLLRMLFTQNIDCLERQAGVPAHLIVEAHGSFATQRCIECATLFPDDEMRQHVEKGAVPRCSAGCGGLVKPDIVFFGEQLPARFHDNRAVPASADLVLILGTSLTVHPFASLPQLVPEGVPRVLFNLEQVGGIGMRADDVLALGSCDAGVRALADALGWRDDLERIWRAAVGDEEAERQLATAQTGGSQVTETAVERLADEVDQVLHLDGRADPDDPRREMDKESKNKGADEVESSNRGSSGGGGDGGSGGGDDGTTRGSTPPAAAVTEDDPEWDPISEGKQLSDRDYLEALLKQLAAGNGNLPLETVLAQLDGENAKHEPGEKFSDYQEPRAPSAENQNPSATGPESTSRSRRSSTPENKDSPSGPLPQLDRKESSPAEPAAATSQPTQTPSSKASASPTSKPGAASGSASYGLAGNSGTSNSSPRSGSPSENAGPASPTTSPPTGDAASSASGSG